MDAAMNTILSFLTPVVATLLLLLYLPVSVLWRLVKYALARPFSGENMAGKVVLITGASSGIGEQIAYVYAQRGASMALVARREQALKAVAKTARMHGAPDVITIAADISSADESKRVIQETVDHFGQLNHLVVNAGVSCGSLFDEISNISAFNQVMDVNFWGSIYPTYYAIPYLKISRGRVMVNASVAGSIPTARLSVYNASKAAQIRFYETLRSELGSEVGITIAQPGYVASEITKGKAVQQNGQVQVNEEVRDIMVGPYPIARTEDCAVVMVNAACKGDQYITWPSWYRPLYAIMFFAPEIVNLFSRVLFVGKSGDDSSNTLSKKISEVRSKNFLSPNGKAKGM